MNKYIRYLKYVLRHKWFVVIECFKIGLFWQGIIHDLSKFRFDEFIPYARHFYGSTNEKKYKKIAQTKGGYSKSQDKKDIFFDHAWLFHIHRNPHHWQYWILIQDEDDDKILNMPIKYISEMICDWRGAGKAQGRRQPNELQDWYKAYRNKMQLSNETRKQIEEIIL